MRIKGFGIALLMILIPFGAVARQGSVPKFQVNVDRQPLVQGEPFTLTITIEVESDEDPEVRLPRLSGLRVLRQSESHPRSFHFSFGFGQQRTSFSKRQSIYSFVVVADKAGKYKIDPVTVVVGGRKYRGDSYVLEVVGSGAPPPAIQPAPRGGSAGQPPDDEEPQGAPPPDMSAAELEGAKVDPSYFVQSTLSKKEAVVGEVVILTVYLYTAAHISDLEVLREPGTEGFWVENLLPSNRRLTTEPVQVAGREYDRTVLRKIALYPIKPGTLTIAPTLVEIQTMPGGFFSRPHTTKRSSLPVSVKVTDLPAKDQPADFHPANVGNYTFKAATDNASVKVGEPLTLVLTVAGEGNIRNLTLPELGDEIEGFKTYAPENEVDVQTQGESVVGKRQSRILMIPKEPGQYEIPSISWSHYDPRAKAYKTLTSKPIPVEVRPGSQPAVTAVGKTSAEPKKEQRAGQDRLNRKLRSILSRAELSPNNGQLTITRPWFIALILGAPLLYLGVVLVRRQRRKMAEDRVKGRSKRADNEALKKLAALRKSMNELTTEAFFAELARTLIGFLEDRLEAPVAGDTMSELKSRLQERGFSGELSEKVVTELESCDFARFARDAGVTEEKHQALGRVEQLVKDLARVRVIPEKGEK